MCIWYVNTASDDTLTGPAPAMQMIIVALELSINISKNHNDAQGKCIISFSQPQICFEYFVILRIYLPGGC